MSDWIIAAGLSLAAGLAMPVGAAIAQLERIRPQWLENEFRHSVIAFGGGALLSAIALVLVPEGTKGLSPLVVMICFAFGGFSFLGLDLLLASRQSPASQLAAMLSDFIHEALALGSAFAAGNSTAPLLAGLIALQNLPEGFNAFREMRTSSIFPPRKLIGAFTLMAMLGPVMAVIGYFWLSAFPTVVSFIMLFAAGGILYLIFQDIAPQAKLERHWAPPLGAVAGFLLGLIGQMMIAG